ncbi:MAG: CocE/NonD family hydrolase [Myxococcales bacterium]|nr:CocE/NonD family hydrolase [Myxococcales bacterium]
MRNIVAFSLALSLTLSFAGCGGDGDGGANKDAAGADGAGVDGAATDAGATDGGEADGGQVDAGEVDAGPNGDFVSRGSVEQIFVTHAPKKTELEALDKAGKVVATGTTDELGSLVFRKIAPGAGYNVRTTKAPELKSGPVTVLSIEGSLPKQAFYDGQVIKPGNGYLKMRDGTTLAYFATLPGPEKDGPYPTVVNYSGYDPGRPGTQVVPEAQKFYCDVLPVLCNAPSDPSAMVAAAGGYATVSVNMRGTGCSGGAYDYFETLQLLDGYDIIETVAAQSWVAHHKVGMVGLSYPGISQMFVAKTNPPSLAGIAPMSVIGNTATTLVPGGILNKGFAVSWINHVYKKAAPYGQKWEQKQVDGGDKVCEENQLLHNQRVNNVEQAKNSAYYQPDLINPLNPSLWVSQISVPVFMANAWQDEQTGPFFSTLLDQFTKSPSRRFMVYNGVHGDGFAPQVLVEWKAFLDIYVARKKPAFGGLIGVLMPQVGEQVFGVGVEMPKSRWDNVKDYKEAKAKWEAEPEVHAVFQSGAVKPIGAPKGSFAKSFSQWPPKETVAQRWFLQPDGTLGGAKPTIANSASQFKLDPTAGDRGILGKGPGLWKAKPAYDWKAPKKGFVAGFSTPALKKNLVMMGTGSLDLWVRSPVAGATDADLEINLTEIRPDGQEMYVQSGWLRASHRKLKKEATELWPEPSLVMEDITPLKVGEWTKMRVAIAAFGHVFMKGSKIRIAIDTPGDSRADWRFSLVEFKSPVHYEIGHDAAHPSSVALPVLDGVGLPDGVTLAACPSLRGQPCRKFVQHDNVIATP